MMVPINDIRVGKRLRGLREATVTELIESIGRLGLQAPITVSSHPARREGGGMDVVAFDLIAGNHRLEACKRLGWEEIEASIFQMSENERELWEIDENLCRADLTELERGEHLARRKALYEDLHPQARQHVAGAVAANEAMGNATENSAVASFGVATAEKMGVADRTIRQSIRRVAKIDEKVRDRIRDNPEIADSGVELDALAAMEPAQQTRAVDLVKAGHAAGIRAAKKLMEPKAPSKDAHLRALRERHRFPMPSPPPDDVDKLKQVLMVARGDPKRIANRSIEERVALARTCLALLRVTLDDLRAP